MLGELQNFYEKPIEYFEHDDPRSINIINKDLEGVNISASHPTQVKNVKLEIFVEDVYRETHPLSFLDSRRITDIWTIEDEDSKRIIGLGFEFGSNELIEVRIKEAHTYEKLFNWKVNILSKPQLYALLMTTRPEIAHKALIGLSNKKISDLKLYHTLVLKEDELEREIEDASKKLIIYQEELDNANKIIDDNTYLRAKILSAIDAMKIVGALEDQK